MKILISGATGYIGKNLVEKLLRDGHALSAIIRPSTNASGLNQSVKRFVYDGSIDKLDSFLLEQKFDGIVHLATLYIAAHSPKDIAPMLESNISFGTTLLDAASRANIPWFINTSTQAQHFDNKPYSPINLYAATKQAFEDIAKYYSEATDTTVVTLELFETYGPKDPRPKVVNLWLKALKTGQTMDFPPGMQIIDLCHINDIADAYIRTIELLSKDPKKINGCKFSLITKNRVSLKKLAAMFEEILGGKLHIKWGAKDYGPRVIMEQWNKGKKLPGWKPKISLEEGIKTLNE